MANLTALAIELGAALQARNLTLALAESCTGGMAAQAVTSVAGSSAWFDRGFVVYSNQAKTDMLNVSKLLLETVGAVSEEVAAALANGAIQQSDANIAASITGIAGPSGGTHEKPVGTVCFGFCYKKQVFTATQHYSGNRESIRMQSVEYVLKQLVALSLNGKL